MARGKDTSGSRIGPSYRGQFYQYVKGEQLVTAAWPKPRGKPRNENQRREQVRYRLVCYAMKALPAETQNWAREAVKNSPFLPRDILMSALYNRGPQLIFPDGTRITNLATKVNMSEVMDNISYEMGDLLYRGEHLWMGLPRPAEQSTLVFDPVTKAPKWLPSPIVPTGVMGDWMYQVGNDPSASLFNSKGSAYQFSIDTVLHAVMFNSPYPAADVCRLSIYKLDASAKIIQVIGRYPLTSQPAAAPRALTAKLSPTLFLSANTWYGFCVEMTNRANNYANPTQSTAGTKFYVPWVFDTAKPLRMAKVSPAVGDTFEVPSANANKVALNVSVDHY